MEEETNDVFTDNMDPCCAATEPEAESDIEQSLANMESACAATEEDEEEVAESEDDEGESIVGYNAQ